MAQDLTKLADRLAAGVRDYVARALQPLTERFAAMETTLAALPAQLKGDKGDKGDAGPAGDRGPQGEKGMEGAPGAAGPAGEPGPAGDRGDPGPAGEPGPAGPQGEKGMPGERGEKGQDGPVGARGEPGPMGEKGEPGERGEPGPPGERGPQGEPGPAGPAGERGEKGMDGAVGPRGEPGPVGQKGDTGERGERGETGPAGEAGPAGRDADTEVVRSMVAAAVQQIPVPKDGRDGRDGEPGRDAVHVDILDGIDPAKRYARNTFAIHAGGLVRSFKATEPLSGDAVDLERAGWHVVLRGLEDISIDLDDDLRTVRVRCAMTGSKVVEKAVTVPAMIDRGIFRAETRYEAGDVVTWDGCMWVCRGVALNVRPGISKGEPMHEESTACWRLAVKRGRDGRDGVRGEKGDRGDQGRPGKDATQIGPNGGKW